MIGWLLIEPLVSYRLIIEVGVWVVGYWLADNWSFGWLLYIYSWFYDSHIERCYVKILNIKY